jgi:hypothetical protein
MDNNQPIGILTQALAALQYGRDSPSTSNEKPYTLQIRMRLWPKI